MPRLAANIEWQFTDLDFPDRIRAAKDAGFDVVEFHMWRDKDVDAIRRALDETGVTVSSFLIDPRTNITDPSAQEAFVASAKDAIETAKRLGASAILPFTGMLREGVPVEEQKAALVAALKAIAPLVEEAGLGVLIEPVNTNVDHPGVYLDSTAKGLDLVEAVGSPAFTVLYDKYHSDAQHEDTLEVLGDRAGLVGYVQVADSHGRAEPGTGDIDWTTFMADLASIGFDGVIGLEYHPSADTLASYEAAHRALGI